METEKAVKHTPSGCAACAATPELLEAAKQAESAIADIINAADNGEPYTAKELADDFGQYTAMLHAAIAKAEEGR